MYEGFLKDWLIEDVYKNLDPGQYGGLKGTGTDHMLVLVVDRILQLLDINSAKSAVLMAMVDWTAAFDMQDPTIAIQKFIKMGVRSSLTPLLISYLSGRTMRVKFNGDLSKYMMLTGGGPQGTILGVDDLSILELIS